VSLLEVRDLKKYFRLKGPLFAHAQRVLKAVDGVSFAIDEGETLGVVGESGCGKTTLGRCILRLIEPTDGDVRFDGRDLMALSHSEVRRLRREMQIIFQDPYASLNPRMRVGDIIEEGLIIHGLHEKNRQEVVRQLLDVVGLRAEHARRFPHEFSGGQRQRIGIARALSVEPRLIVADECVSALDVSIQAQIINLLQELQEKRGFAYMFISHDLRVISQISHRVAVMYLGKIVEIAPKRRLFATPAHPYTRALLEAVPNPDSARRTRRAAISVEAASQINPPTGCRFHPRCAYRKPICAEVDPELREGEHGHAIACHVFG
jgi:oligopeptide/dipeptide ABC transporter ATP-binding protein